MTNTKNPRKTPVLDWFGKLFAVLGGLLIIGIFADHLPVGITVALIVMSFTISGLFMYASILKGEGKS